MKNAIAIMFMLLFLSPCVYATPPKNVILFIGDGMGFQQVYAAECYAGSPMFFRSFPYQGQVTTRSADNAVTDSAAAGTAIATGIKVNNGVISMAFPGDGSELQTILEYCQLAGKKVGLVTTTYLTHATPAVFGAHEASRNNYSAIGQDILIRSRPNVLLGGGENGISPAGATSAGYNVVTDLAGFSAAVTNSSYTSSFAGLFGNTYMPYKYDYLSGTYPYPTLAEMTAAAIAALGDDSDGFFLMVEGGLIDQACHSNDLARCIFEVIDLNNAVIAACNAFAGNGETLILVTADHETGGLTDVVNNGAGVLPTVHWSSTNHTAANLPVYAWGKNSLLASGTLDNTQIRSICTRDDKATNPYPSVGQTDVPTEVTLSWTAGVGATQHQVVVWTTDPANPVVDVITTATQYALTCQANTTYSWAVNEVDTGIPGDTWSFTTQQVQVTLIPAGATWKYSDTNTDFYTLGWPSADDSQWASGAAPLGYGDSHIITTLTMGSPRYPTYYFRKSFELTHAYQAVTLKVMRDDGCLVYLNGIEVARTGMPNEDITHTTWATNTSGDADETTYHEFNLNPALLTVGTNILAVDVHQCNGSSTDLGFDLTLSGAVCPALEAHDDSVSTDEDTPIVIDVLSNDVDPENDPLTVTSVTQPGHGSATINGDGTITYTPASNFSGTDTFTYTVEDGHSSSDSAMVTITVDSTDNDPPAAFDDAVSTADGAAITIDVLSNDTDPDHDILSIYEVTQPSHGTAVIEGRLVVYTPDPGFTGTDTFTYTAQDTAGGFASAAVTVLVTAVNDPPIAYDDAVSTQEDTAIVIDVLGNDTDPENDALSVKSITQPDHGTAAVNQYGTVTFTPNPNFNGTDTFTYIAGDGLLDSGAAVVTITVNPVNDAPTAADDQAQTAANTPVVIAVVANDSDIEGDALTVVQLTEPGHGTVSLNTADQTITYTPAPGFAGQDTFTYAAFDGDIASLAATVTVEVIGIDYDAYAAAEPVVGFGVVTGTIAGTTAAGDGLVQRIEEGSNGPAAYSLRIEYALHTQADPAGVSEPVTINLGHTWTGGTVDGLLIELVVGGVWTDITADIADGQCQASAGDVIDAQGDIHVRFSDKVNQKKEVKDTLVIDLLYAHIAVGPRNITAQDDSYTIEEDGILTVGAVGVLANDHDADLDPLTASVAVGPGFGFLTMNSDGSFMYTPGADYHGLDSFTYTASDGNGNSAAATVVITVTPVNDAPAASDDSAATQQNTAVVIDVLANDSDIDGDTLAVTSITAPAYGTDDLSNNTITYTPNAGYVGADSFNYTVSDGHGGTVVGTVTVTVTEASSTLDMYIANITMQKIIAGKNVYATATVRVLDVLGNPVVGAVVSGNWSGSASGSVSGTTDGSGLVVLRSANVKNGGTFTFSVTDVVLNGYAYNPGLNSETSDSI
ncbi:MAG TPA: Ig-like domain-containing protein [Anaerohalosphaeraceae bacterium]|nr:Ig-like domain-containing protein [Anaerohalosphaeraceae bacterium]